MHFARLLAFLPTTLLASTVASGQANELPLVPEAPSLRSDVAQALEAVWLDEDERVEGRLHHGVWTDEDLDLPDQRARAMLHTATWDDDVFLDDALSVERRAEALVLRGRALPSDGVPLRTAATSTSHRPERHEATWIGPVS